MTRKAGAPSNPAVNNAKTKAETKAETAIHGRRLEASYLGVLWKNRHTAPIVFTSLDTEFQPDTRAIYELGIATQPAIGPVASHHYTVNSTMGLRKRSTKSFPFGKSESLRTEGDLLPILDQHFSDLVANYEVVVLCGHSISGDLTLLKEVANWAPPDNIFVFDTQRVWEGLGGLAAYLNGGKTMAKLLLHYRVPHNVNDIHNAGSDAYYTLKLLFCKAEQAAQDRPCFSGLMNITNHKPDPQQIPPPPPSEYPSSLQLACPQIDIIQNVMSQLKSLLPLPPAPPTPVQPGGSHKRSMPEDAHDHNTSECKRRKTDDDHIDRGGAVQEQSEEGAGIRKASRGTQPEGTCTCTLLDGVGKEGGKEEELYKQPVMGLCDHHVT
ncbi:hypothetical protein UCRPA7_2463 [Phaeoacremonium minimum UCRPA7]|uniref:Gfd2/YDR514C-like C-terminal domain-containing protein n=1 Tax=Phaeoacremonium minimum (strain UCR-PA7) TaxID=1286976 RepID=R8BRW6_PHAM7|nr:hypothetical protein UCRPA7_2463 [Phaeoacremonium minimum UCRPA7]EOO02030.1 hypothetical protein UCRPA7_2463 [Phaeoacremonium minimum UCRPA7]